MGLCHQRYIYVVAGVLATLVLAFGIAAIPDALAHEPKPLPLQPVPSALRGTLVASTPAVRQGDTVMFLATVEGADQVLDCSSSTTTPFIRIDSKSYAMCDDGHTAGDFRAGDGIYTQFVAIDTKTGPLSITLHVNSTQLTTTTIDVYATDVFPHLLLITDWCALYEEFEDAGMIPDENLSPCNTTSPHDFVDLVEHITQYTRAYSGMSVHLPAVITKTRGFPFTEAVKESGCSGDYAALSYQGSTKNRFCKAALIDEMIQSYSTSDTATRKQRTAYMVLVGDDEVVPFFRYRDPLEAVDFGYGTNQSHERAYLRKGDSAAPHPVIEDMWQGFLMTDVPYSIYTPQNRGFSDVSKDTLGKPIPDMGIGRVFASRPCELIQTMKLYDQPLHLTQEKTQLHEAAAELFVGRDIPLSHSYVPSLFQIAARSQIIPLSRWALSNAMKAVTIHDAAVSPWTAEHIVAAQNAGKLVTITAHADHLSMHVNKDLAVEAEDLHASLVPMPALQVALGNHMGLVLSEHPHNPGAMSKRFVYSIPNVTLGRGVTLFAPTTFAYAYHSTLVSLSSLHERMGAFFIDHTLDYAVPTVGDLWKYTLALYDGDTSDYKIERDPATQDNDHPMMDPLFTKTAYSMALFGLPTQPLRPRHASLCSGIAEPATVIERTATSSLASLATNHEEIIPLTMKPTWQQLADGTMLFSVDGGDHHVLPNGAIVPRVRVPVQLPDWIDETDAAAIRVTLVHSQTQVYDTPVRLPHAQPHIIGGPSFFLPSSLSDYVPDQLYSVDVVDVGSSRRLMLNIIPLIYTPATHQATVVTDMVFRIELPTPPSLSVATEQLGTLTFDSTTQRLQIGIPQKDGLLNDVDLSGNAVLAWTFNDGTGKVMATDRVLLNIPHDKPKNATLVYTIPQQYQLSDIPDSAFMDVHLALCNRQQSPSELEDWGRVVSDLQPTQKLWIVPYRPGEKKKRACGESSQLLAAKDMQRLYFAPDKTVEWTFCIQDKDEGVVPNDHTDSLSVSIDGIRHNTVTITKDDNHLYHASLPLDALSPGIHVVRTELKTDDGYAASTEVLRYYNTGTRVYEEPSLSDTTTHIYSTTNRTMQGVWGVRVENAQGQPVTGLPDTAFTVTVDGKLQSYSVQEQGNGLYTITLTITEALIGTNRIAIVVENGDAIARFDGLMQVTDIGICQQSVCPPPAPTCTEAHSWQTVSSAAPGTLSTLTPMGTTCEYYIPESAGKPEQGHLYTFALDPGQTVEISMTNILTGANYDIVLHKQGAFDTFVAASSLIYHHAEHIYYRVPTTETGRQWYYLQVVVRESRQPFNYYRLLVDARYVDSPYRVWLPQVYRQSSSFR